MNIRLFALERWMPRGVHRRMLGELASLTAEAFGTNPPALAGLGRTAAIDQFASFTRTVVEHLLATAPATTVAATAARLYERAREMGRAARRDLRITTRADALRAARVLYRAIDIRLDVNSDTGVITVHRCAFSGAYTPDVCAFVSALDSGFFCGLTGDSGLVFSQRITEGAACCRATLVSTAGAERNRPKGSGGAGTQPAPPGRGRR